MEPQSLQNEIEIGGRKNSKWAQIKGLTVQQVLSMLSKDRMLPEQRTIEKNRIPN